MVSGSRPGTPEFLSLPARPPKPRAAGLTHVLDNGLALAEMQGRLESIGQYIDIWKFGYGLSYIDRQLPQKLALLAAHDIKACPGGTLLEISWMQQQIDRYLAWLQNIGFGCVEVSNGASPMQSDIKRELIATAAELGFEVFAEVGSKDPDEIAEPADWALEAKGDLAAGATWIVAEGRESGTVGLYNSSGTVRRDLVVALETVSADAKVIYEAPRRAQQAWLIANVGPNVSLANVATDGVLSVEALRLGLRADTMRWADTKQWSDTGRWASNPVGEQCSS